jgi:protein required for attachment to host cells
LTGNGKETTMRIDHDTWVLVLDGEKFLLMRNNGDADLLDLRMVEHDEIENPPTSEQGSERPGRMPDAVIGRSAVGETDWHALAKEDFAKEIADKLRRWALEDRFSSLVVVADAQTLGTLRKAYHKEVQARIVDEVAKDLTGMPVDKIEKVLLAA